MLQKGTGQNQDPKIVILSDSDSLCCIPTILTCGHL